MLKIEHTFSYGGTIGPVPLHDPPDSDSELKSSLDVKDRSSCFSHDSFVPKSIEVDISSGHVTDKHASRDDITTGKGRESSPNKPCVKLLRSKSSSVTQQSERRPSPTSSLFRPSLEEPKSSFWTDREDMLSLKRANPIYDSDDEDDYIELHSSPSKRPRSSSSFDEGDEEETELPATIDESLLPSDWLRGPTYFESESSWRRKGRDSKDSRTVLCTDEALGIDDLDRFVVPMPLSQGDKNNACR